MPHTLRQWKRRLLLSLFCWLRFWWINRRAEFWFRVVAITNDSDVCLWGEASVLCFFNGTHLFLVSRKVNPSSPNIGAIAMNASQQCWSVTSNGVEVNVSMRFILSFPDFDFSDFLCENPVVDFVSSRRFYARWFCCACSAIPIIISSHDFA